MLVMPTAGPGSGLFLGKHDITAWNRTGGTSLAGDLVMLDFLASATETVNAIFGDDGSIWANYIDPSAASQTGGVFTVYGVCLEPIEDNKRGKIRVYGSVQAFVIATSGSVAIGSRLFAATDGDLDLVSAVDEVAIAWGLEAVDTPTTRTLAKTFINGFVGLFNVQAEEA